MFECLNVLMLEWLAQSNYSNIQTIKQSNNQTIKQSNNQTIRQSNNHFLL